MHSPPSMSFSFPESVRLPNRSRQQASMSTIPLRSPMSMSMPMEEQMHRSMPTSPYDIDQRDPRAMSAPFGSRVGTDGPDYFSAMGLGPMGQGPMGHHRHQGSQFPPGFGPEAMMGPQQQYVDEMVRRTNLMVQFVNSQVRPAARYCQVQPKMCSDAKFPVEFRVPKTVEEIRAMDPSSVDRLLRAYGLPTDLRSLRMTTQDSFTPRTAHQAKLCTLFDFLGATQISERQRMKRGMCLPY